MNSLPEISPMDHVFGGVEECEDDGGEEETMIDQSSFHYVASSNDIHQSSSIAYTTCLLALANMSVPKCCTSRKCGKPCSWDVKLQGTAITLMRVFKYFNICVLPYQLNQISVKSSGGPLYI